MIQQFTPRIPLLGMNNIPMSMYYIRYVIHSFYGIHYILIQCAAFHPQPGMHSIPLKYVFHSRYFIYYASIYCLYIAYKSKVACKSKVTIPLEKIQNHNAHSFCSGKIQNHGVCCICGSRFNPSAYGNFQQDQKILA